MSFLRECMNMSSPEQICNNIRHLSWRPHPGQWDSRLLLSNSLWTCHDAGIRGGVDIPGSDCIHPDLPSRAAISKAVDVLSASHTCFGPNSIAMLLVKPQMPHLVVQ